MRARRCKIEIVKEVLELLSRKHMSKTEIIKRSNLNFNTGIEILEQLEARGLIEKRGNKYTITKKGIELQEVLISVEDYLIYY